MGTHDLAQNGPGGGLTNGALGASSHIRDGISERPADVRNSFPREDKDCLQESARAPQGFSHHEIVSLGPAEDPEHYYTSLVRNMKSQKRQDRGDEMGGARHRKAISVADHAEPSLRAILSDPLTGELMEDATILPCGHSFGAGGINQALKTNACISCGVSVSQELLSPNFALQAAVQAYKREESFRKPFSKKRRKEMNQQDQLALTDQASPDALRRRVVQFPFSVGDRVVIKGNKRTPDRFVGREALITTQCLNGWYLVKTVDNGETVKLQYRSLRKGGDQLSSHESQARDISSNWL